MNEFCSIWYFGSKTVELGCIWYFGSTTIAHAVCAKAYLNIILQVLA